MAGNGLMPTPLPTVAETSTPSLSVSAATLSAATAASMAALSPAARSLLSQPSSKSLNSLASEARNMLAALPAAAATVDMSRESMNVPQLMSLQAAFDRYNGGFTEQQFIKTFGTILGNRLNNEQLTQLFLKIDANSDGRVDWDEFTNFMFLESNETHMAAEYIPRLYQRAVKASTAAARGAAAVSTAAALDGDDDAREPETFRQLRGYFNDMGLSADRLAAMTKGAVIKPSNKPYEKERLETSIATSLAIAEKGYSAVANRPSGDTEYLGDAMGRRSFQPRIVHGQAHNDLIVRILRIPAPERYVTAGRDGVMCVWEETSPDHLVCRQSFRTGQEWIADMTFLKQSNKMVVVTVEGTLSFYNFSMVADIVTLTGRIQSSRIAHGAALSCDAYVDAQGNDVLLVGDDSGMLHHVLFHDRNWHTCDGHLPSRCHNYPVFKGVSIVSTPCHQGWVSQVMYVEALSSILTCSVSGELCLFDVTKKKLTNKHVHTHAVTNFDWSNTLRVVAFCGGDRTVVLWNPYSKDILSVLTGHTAPVVKVLFDDEHAQLITLTNDMYIRVWDMRAQRIIQVFRDDSDTVVSPTWVPTMLLNPKTSSLMTATRTLSVWPQLPMPGTGVAGQDMQGDRTGVCSAIYNEAFHQVISHDSSKRSTVFIWDVETGKLMSQFDQAHGANPITAIALDREHRRLFTGSHIGDVVKVWNFSNGSLLKKLLKTAPRKATGRVLKSSRPAPTRPKSPIRMSPRAVHKKTKANLASTKVSYFQDCQELLSTSSVPLAAAGYDAAALDFDYDDDDDEYSPGVLVDDSMLQPFKAAVGPARSGQLHTGGKRHRAINEVSQIEYIGRMIAPPTGHGPATMQKFVVTVGCDSKLYVFRDGADAQSPCEPLHVMPSARDERAGNKHTQDLLAVAFCPPSAVATAGLDGAIRLWSLDTGKHTGLLYNPKPSGEPNAYEAAGIPASITGGIQDVPALHALVYAPRLNLLIAAGEAPHLMCFNPAGGTLEQVYKTGLEEDDCIMCMKTSTHNELLLTGSLKGYVTVWQVVGAESDKEGMGMLVPLSKWQASKEKVCSIGLIEHLKLPDTFVLTCSWTGSSVWTVSGEMVGQLGQSTPWHLQDPATYRSRKTHWLQDEQMDKFGVVLRRPQAARSCYSRPSTAAAEFDDTSSTRRWAVPEPGQVWFQMAVNSEGKPHGMPRRLPAPAAFSGEAASVHGLALDRIARLLTVSRVTKDTVIGWAGTGKHRGESLFIPLAEFTAPDLRRGMPWIHYQALSRYVGRIFRDPMPEAADDADDEDNKGDAEAAAGGGGLAADAEAVPGAMTVEQTGDVEPEPVVVPTPYKVLHVHIGRHADTNLPLFQVTDTSLQEHSLPSALSDTKAVLQTLGTQVFVPISPRRSMAMFNRDLAALEAGNMFHPGPSLVEDGAGGFDLPPSRAASRSLAPSVASMAARSTAASQAGDAASVGTGSHISANDTMFSGLGAGAGAGAGFGGARSVSRATSVAAGRRSALSRASTLSSTTRRRRNNKPRFMEVTLRRNSRGEKVLSTTGMNIIKSPGGMPLVPSAPAPSQGAAAAGRGSRPGSGRRLSNAASTCSSSSNDSGTGEAAGAGAGASAGVIAAPGGIQFQVSNTGADQTLRPEHDEHDDNDDGASARPIVPQLNLSGLAQPARASSASKSARDPMLPSVQSSATPGSFTERAPRHKGKGKGKGGASPAGSGSGSGNAGTKLMSLFTRRAAGRLDTRTISAPVELPTSYRDLLAPDLRVRSTRRAEGSQDAVMRLLEHHNYRNLSSSQRGRGTGTPSSGYAMSPQPPTSRRRHY